MARGGASELGPYGEAEGAARAQALRLFADEAAEEFVETEEAVDALGGVAGAAEFVGGVGVAHVLDGAVEDFEGAEEHFALGGAGAAVVVAVFDQERGDDVLGVGKR